MKLLQRAPLASSSRAASPSGFSTNRSTGRPASPAPGPGTIQPKSVAAESGSTFEAMVLNDDGQHSRFSEVTFYSGGGGLVSTVGDYYRFCRMLLAGGTVDGARIIGSRTLAFMTRNHLPGGADMSAIANRGFSETEYEGVGFGLGFATKLDPVRNGYPASPGSFYWGGLASTLLGGGGGSQSVGGTVTSSSTGSTVTITSDPRLNTLYVTAMPRDLDMVESFLKLVDREESSDPPEGNKPRFIQVVHSKAADVAQLVREQYAGRIVGEQSGQGFRGNVDPGALILQAALGGRGGPGGRGRRGGAGVRPRAHRPEQ